MKKAATYIWNLSDSLQPIFRSVSFYIYNVKSDTSAIKHIQFSCVSHSVGNLRKLAQVCPQNAALRPVRVTQSESVTFRNVTFQVVTMKALEQGGFRMMGKWDRGVQKGSTDDDDDDDDDESVFAIGWWYGWQSYSFLQEGTEYVRPGFSLFLGSIYNTFALCQSFCFGI